MKTVKQIPIFLLFCTIIAALFYGDTPQKDIILLYPDQTKDSISYEQGKIFLLSVAKSADTSVVVSTQWQVTNYWDVFSDSAKNAFPKDFIRLFPPNSTIQKIWYSFKFRNYFSAPDSIQYAYTDSVSVRTFWQKPELSKLLGEVRSTSAGNMLLVVRGWQDTSYTTPYDDPNADNRGLFKLQLHLLPGDNSLYFAPGGRRAIALGYITNLTNESKPLDTREGRFHNSELEKGCTPCHEGLPGADSGRTMKADCATCHKALASGSTIHSPVEMKECGTCHDWSQEKNSMVVTKGIPDACYDCHSDKKVLVDSAKVQHPVAADCITCHSPHACNEAPHLVKKNIFDLCTGCHDDKAINHPVGKHPVRFALTRTGEEISCVSCHNPHGSENDHLLTVAGGNMMVCTKCH